jgi:hypothetical protein
VNRSELTGRWVQFKVRDIYYPQPEQVLLELHGDDAMSGVVIDISDSGTEQNAFVVVQVDALSGPVVVAIERVRGRC